MTLRKFAVVFGALLFLTLAKAFSQTSPLIISQPQSQSAYFGQTITLSVTAIGGAPPLRYQWQKDALSIMGATNSTLVLRQLESSHAGAYIVIVSDNSGASVTSSPPAIVTVKSAEASIALHPGVTIDGAVGLTYGIQFSTDLGNTNSWQGIANVTLTAPHQTWFDPQPAALPKRYYRILPGPISIP
jgi:hypothetical protein